MAKLDRREKTILIVEDDPILARAVSKILSDQLYNTRYTASGKNAIKLVKQIKVDLVLLDIGLKDGNRAGFNVCRKLKSNPDTQNIPIIFLTALSDQRELVKGFNWGGDDFIFKPFKDPELLARIETHIGFKDAKEMNQKFSEEKFKGYMDISSQMVPFISHSIRNSIQNIEHILLKFNSKNIEIENINSIKHYLNYIREILDNYDLLRQNKVTFKLEELLSFINGCYKNHSQYKAINLITEIEKIDNDLMIHQKLFDISIIFLNMLNNSINAFQSCIKKEILINISKDSINNIIFEVSDTGIGIDKEFNDRIFDVNFSTTGSSGIGLPHIEHILGKINGKINLQVPRKNFSTTFLVKIPIK